MAAKWNVLFISVILSCLLCSIPVSAFTISASSGNKGMVQPSGMITADPGSALSLTITPDTGYLVREVLVDGISHGNITTCTFSDISEDHTVYATFEQDLSGTETLITTEPLQMSQISPDIDGDNIVWEDSFADVFLYNPVTGNERNLRPQGNDNGFTNPVISGNVVAWEEQNATDGRMDILIYDISLSAVIGLITGPSETDQQHPAIDGNRIVWEDSRGGDSDIYMYDILSGSESPIAHGPDTTYQNNPSISGDRVVWQDSRNGTSDIFLYDITSPPEVPLIAGPSGSDQTVPSICGDKVVWQDSRSGNDDIYVFNLTSRTETLLSVATNTSNQRNPAISGEMVAWEDSRGVNTNIYTYDILTGTESAISSYPSEQGFPVVSGNRIVWQDSRRDNSDIFLFTIGESQECPVADFDQNVTIGDIPLTVQFTDLSGGGPTVYCWEFGDGSTSFERHPIHTYMIPGLYTVTLTVSNPACRNAFSAVDLISAQNIPHANFSANRTTGYPPVTIEFLDLSTGSPEQWYWDFGDGFVSTEENPHHTYGEGGSYTVNLTVTNAYGSDSQKARGCISVLSRIGPVLSLDIGGLEILVQNDRSTLSINGSSGLQYRTDQDNTTLAVFPSRGNGVQEVNFFASDYHGFKRLDNGTISGNFSHVIIESGVIPVNTSGLCIGCPIQYSINTSAYPQNGEISAYAWGGAVPEDEEIIIRTIFYAGFSGLNNVAYEIAFVSSDIDDMGIACFNLSVNASWVNENGGTGSIWVVRIADDVSEVLPATFLFYDSESNRDFFSVESPRGMSRFALTSLFGSGNPFQLLTYKLISIFATPAPVDTSDGDWPVSTPTPRIPPQFNPPPSIPTIIITPGPADRQGNVPVDEAGRVKSTIMVQSADGLFQMDLPTGTFVSDSFGNPVDEVRLVGPYVPPLPPVQFVAGSMDTGLFYSIFPNGTTYNPPVTVTLTIPSMLWDESMDYSVWQYDTLSSQWVELPSTLSPRDRSVSFLVSRSGVVTVMKTNAPVRPQGQGGSSSPHVATRPGSDQVSIVSGMILWFGEQLTRFFSVVVIAVVAVVLALVFLNRRRYRL